MNLILNKTCKLVIVAFIISTTAFGQQRGGQQGAPQLPSTEQIENMVSDLADEILLSDEQETDVLELYKDHFEVVENKIKSGRPDRNEMETLKENFENDVKDSLTKDQQKLYATYLKKSVKRQKPQRK